MERGLDAPGSGNFYRDVMDFPGLYACPNEPTKGISR